MAEWDQLRRALGGQDAGGARGAEHVALGGVAAPHGAQGRRLHLDDRASDGLAGGLWLGGHVDHAGVTTSGEMRKAAEGRRRRRLPRPIGAPTRQALTPARACRMIDSIRSFASSVHVWSPLLRQRWS